VLAGLVLGLVLGLPPASPEDTAGAVSLDAPRPLSHHSAHRWSMQDGLPQDSITGIAQDPEGNLWLATFGGLARFDGLSFETFDPTTSLDDPRVLALSGDGAGGLWLGFQSGGVGRFAGGRLERPAQPEALRSSPVSHLVAVGDSLWVAARAGLFRRDGAAWTQLSATDFTTVAPFGPREAVATGIESSARIRADQVSIDADPQMQVFREPDGTEWRQHADRLVLVRAGRARTVAVWSETDWLTAAPVVDEAQALWFSVGRRAYRLTARPRLLADPIGPLSARDFEGRVFAGGVRRLFLDRERNMWVGTDGDGLWRLRDEPFDDLALRYQLPLESVQGILPEGPERLWVTLGCQGVFLLGPERVERRLLPGVCTSGLARTRDGALWVASQQMLRVEPDSGRVTAVPLPGARTIVAVVSDPGGGLWVGGGERLYRVVDTVATPVPEVDGVVASLVMAPDGALWVGLRNRVLRRSPEGALTALGLEDGVPPGAVRAILHPEAGGLWLGSYGGGITWLDPAGEVRRLTRANGLQDNFVSALLFDAEGNLWVNSNRGAFRILREDLARLAREPRAAVRSLPLATGEAMVANPPYALTQGRLATLATTRGPIQVDLSRARSNPTAPVATILSATLDDTALTPQRWAEVPPGRGRLEVAFGTGMLRRPRLATFRYRLEGLEGEGWHTTDARHPSARYDSLPPGRYSFRVRAINEDGVEGPEAQVPFTLRPHLTDTAGFRGGALLALLLAAWAGHRLRTRQMAESNRALQAQIAQRIEAEAALSQREAHYRQVFEASVNGFFVSDAAGLILAVNPKGCELLGLEAELLLGRPLEEALGRQEPDLEGSGRLLLGVEVVACRRADGQEFLARVDTRAFPSSVEPRFLTTVVDVSPLIEAQAERQRLKEQLLHGQRVQAVGRLAGGIAHDVNNMLTAIQGYTSLAVEAVDEGASPEEIREMLDQVLEGARRTADMTRQLLAFARRQVVSPVGLNLSTLVREAEPFLRGVTREAVRLDLRLAEGLPIVRADRTQLQQVLMNLVINAVQAMPEGGEVRIETGVLEPAALAERYPHLKLGVAHVYLAVDDEGHGMTGDVLAQIFDPFFTTKKVGEGTGLGLSAVQGIVSQAGGHVEVKSAPGEGSRFEVLLPVSAGAEAPAEAAEAPSAHHGGGRTVLYVDDDDDVRLVTDRMLSHAGYQVRAFGTAQALLQEAKAMPGPPDLLVTDVLMPDVRGPDLAARLRTRWPELKVLFVSGYVQEGIRDLPTGMAFLAKPYKHADLMKALRALEGDALPGPL
jgi:two-component system cell cycle sensor histidine kinase/response regulator CckA